MVLNRPGSGSICNIVPESSRLNDRRLVSRCLGGDPVAERALYDAHVERIYRLMHRMAGDADLASDFTQDTFIRAFERLEQYRGESSLATWLHTIAVSVALNGMRKVKRLHGRVESVDGVEGSPHLVVAPTGFTGDLRARLHAAIDSLSEKLRPVFVMHDIEGYTHEEIAGSLSIPVGTSKARLFDARARLRLALAAFAGDHIA